MAKYRLRIAHELETRDGQRVYLQGDITPNDPNGGDEGGTIVGDGTPYVVRWPTLEMIPLDDEAAAMIAKEEARLSANQGTMNPVDDLGDNYEQRYVPGSNRQRRPPAPDGSPVPKRAA